MKAWQIIDSPEKWTKAVYASNSDNYTCGVLDPQAVRFCAVGALCKAYSKEVHEIRKTAIYRKLMASMAIDVEVPDWNDSSDWQTVFNKLKKLDI